jgi:hypothetical protein
MWTKLNNTMLKNGYVKPNFKGFMANNMQENWNVVRIVYDSSYATIRMAYKERICLFHWIQLLDRNTKNLIKLEL